MRAALGAVACLLAAVLLGFQAYSWGWVAVHYGLRQAWDELITSKPNVTSLVLSVGFGLLFMTTGVLLSGESRK